MFMKSIENRIEKDQGKTFNDNLEYFDIDYNKKKKINSNFNDLKSKVFSLKKNKIEKVNKNYKEDENDKLPASKNSINFNTFYVSENKSNMGEKTKTSHNFFKSRVSKSREKTTYSSCSFLRMQNNTNKDLNNIRQLNSRNKDLTEDLSSVKQNNFFSPKNKKSSFNIFSESIGNLSEKEVCNVDLLLKDSKEVNKLKYLTPFLIKDLLTKEKREIKNPFQDSILYPVNDSCQINKRSERIDPMMLEDQDNMKIKLSNPKKKKLIINEELKSNLDEPISLYNLEKEKSRLDEFSKINKEENSFKIHHENKSSGVQCAFDIIKVIDSPPSSMIKENFKVRSPKIKNIIKNAEIRENIKLEKFEIPKITMKNNNNNILSINIYNTQLKEEKQEIYKPIINKINNIDNKRKSKTPNYMKSTISEQNKLINIKKVSSTKPNSLSDLNKDEDCYTKYQDHKKYFKNTKKKFKQFFQISNYEEATQIKYGLIVKKKTKEGLKRIKNKGGYDNNQIDLVKYPPSCIDKNEWNDNRLNLHKHYSSFNSNQQDNKYLHFNHNEDLLKVYFDKNINKYHESYKKNGFIDNCNTSNGFINLGEFNFLERNNMSKNINNPFNSSLKSKENESKIYILSINKSPNRFDGNVENKEKNKALSNNMNLDIFKLKDEENKESISHGNKPSNKNIAKPSINKFDINKNNNSKNRFKILRKELSRDKEKVNFMVENFKESL